MTGPQPPRPPHPPRPSRPGQPSEPTGHDSGLALAGLDLAAWMRAATVQVLPLDYARGGANGRWRGVYTPVPVAHPPQWCDHLDSVCRSCLPAWAEDHALALFRHGPAGARAGCACPVCRTSRPRPDHTTPGDPAAPRPATLHACLPDVGGHHRHLTLTPITAIPVTALPAGPRHGRAGRRFVVVTIPGPDDCPGTGGPGGAKGHLDGRVGGGGRHDCRRDDTAAVPPELLTAAAALLDALADALATGLDGDEKVR